MAIKNKHLKYKKRIVFLTATRADYGKIKSIIQLIQNNKKFVTKVFVTGMHNLGVYGNTKYLIKKDKIKNIFVFKNQNQNDSMDEITSKTIHGFSKFVKKFRPDLIVIHGDRIEPLACAIVGSLNNILVAHIEGGEVSGTVDEMLRHSISKLSHFHFVSNNAAKLRLKQMGELDKNIFIIGSPDIDILLKIKKNQLQGSKKHYNIKFKDYSIVLLHPITTLKDLKANFKYAKILTNVLLNTKNNYIVIYPNNDQGSNYILKLYKKLKNKKNIKIFSSIRFEFFLSLLQNAKFILGNSSAGIREAPYYGVPTINLGSRQNKRSKSKSIYNLNFDEKQIISLIKKLNNTKKKHRKVKEFGFGNSNRKFVKIIQRDQFWNTSNQKFFKDINY